jgi:putative spermidine/putrescine transport system substrate-binding protein
VFAYPKEGAPALMITACVVAGAHDPQDAQAFVDDLLSPPVQTVFAQKTGTGPVNKLVTLTPKEALNVPYGPDAMAKLVTFDWGKINKLRDAWQRQWNRQIER